jgi:hypothetical protein
VIKPLIPDRSFLAVRFVIVLRHFVLPVRFFFVLDKAQAATSWALDLRKYESAFALKVTPLARTVALATDFFSCCPPRQAFVSSPFSRGCLDTW